MADLRPPATTTAKILPAAIALVALVCVGAIGFHLVFGSSWALGLYQTLVTASTLGDSRLVPHTGSQYAFLAGITVLGYASWAMIIAIVAGTLIAIDVRSLWGGRTMAERITALRGHIIVVGGGRVGQQVAEELRRVGRTVVLVDKDPQRIARLTEAGFLALARDAMDEDALAEAGVAHTAGVVLALPDDAQNLYVLFAVRDVAPDAIIVARAESDRAEKHLRAMGVQRIVMPTIVGGKRLARLLSRPLAADFLDTIIDEAGLEMRERPVLAGDALVDCLVRDLRRVLGERVTLLALRRDGRILTLPPADLRVLVGDTLLLVTLEHPQTAP